MIYYSENDKTTSLISTIIFMCLFFTFFKIYDYIIKVSIMAINWLLVIFVSFSEQHRQSYEFWIIVLSTCFFNVINIIATDLKKEK